MYGLGPMEALELAALNGLGLIGADEDEDNDEDSQGGSDSDDDNDGDDTGSDSQGDDDEDDDDDDDGEDEDLTGIKASRDKALKEKAKAKADLAAAQKELAKLKKDGDTRSDAERAADSEKTVTGLQDTIRDLRIQNAFLSDNTHAWHDPKVALQLVNLDEVEIDEDGTVTGLKEALDEVAKNNKFLVKPKTQTSEKRTGDKQRRRDDSATKAQRQQKLRKKYNI